MAAAAAVGSKLLIWELTDEFLPFNRGPRLLQVQRQQGHNARLWRGLRTGLALFIFLVILAVCIRLGEAASFRSVSAGQLWNRRVPSLYL